MIIVGDENRLLATGTAAFAELNDLKRIGSAGHAGSIATRLFGEAWAAIVSGSAPADVTWWIVGRAVAAARLGDIDGAVMLEAGVPAAEAFGILARAIDEVVPPFAASLKPKLFDGSAASLPGNGDRPAFVDRLARQPRAGITCPGKPRILLEPPENHADHCVMVAVYAVLLAPVYEADPARVFLAALAHHFHNAGMPDAGFTGEMLLGRHLDTLVSHYTRDCLRQLAPSLRAEIEDARAILPDAELAEGRAFHAADVLDRVLQTVQYTRAGALTTGQMLGEMELVHAGPVKAFQDQVLREAGLL